MLLTECLINIRDITKDLSGTLWSDVEVSRYIDNAVRMMFRWQVDADPSYHNYEFDLSQSDARSVHSNIFEWDMPSWVYRITGIREQKATTERMGEEVFHTGANNRRPGFRWEHRLTLRVQGVDTSKTYTVVGAKMPARLHKGTMITTDATSTTLPGAIHVAAASTAYPFEKDANWYSNSIIEMTGVASNGHDVVGQARRCTSSSTTEIGSTGTYQTTFTFDQAWTVQPTVATSDTYEMHPEVKDADLRFLFLHAAKQCFASRANLGALEALRPEYEAEEKRFIRSVQPVVDSEPAFWRDGSELHAGIDVDRDILLGRFPYLL